LRRRDASEAGHHRYQDDCKLFHVSSPLGSSPIRKNLRRFQTYKG
jgi:hypothetical protein